MKNWVFLSAHFDDVVLSVGGLVWELSHAGDRVEIWTICAGDPPADMPLTEYGHLLHEFWSIGEDVPRKRSLEVLTLRTPFDTRRRGANRPEGRTTAQPVPVTGRKK